LSIQEYYKRRNQQYLEVCKELYRVGRSTWDYEEWTEDQRRFYEEVGLEIDESKLSWSEYQLYVVDTLLNSSDVLELSPTLEELLVEEIKDRSEDLIFRCKNKKIYCAKPLKEFLDSWGYLNGRSEVVILDLNRWLDEITEDIYNWMKANEELLLRELSKIDLEEAEYSGGS